MSQRLTSRQIYIYKDKLRDIIWGATNMRTLSRKSAIPYNRLRWWFYHQDKNSVEFDEYRIDRLPTSLIYNKTHSQMKGVPLHSWERHLE